MKAELERLLHRLQSGDRSLKRADFELFSDLSRAEVAEFSDVWAMAPAELRLSLMSALAQMSYDSFEYSFARVFKRALDDPLPEVRIQAIRGLWESEDAAVAGRFLHMLQTDSDEDVRAAAAAALGSFVYLGEVEEIEQPVAQAIETALFTAARNPDEAMIVRRRAIEAMGFSSNPEVTDVVRDAYEDGDPGLRASALVAMGRSADRRWRRVVMHEIENPDEEIRAEAARACGELELREAVVPLARVIERDNCLRVRQAAVGALGQAGGPTARKVLDLLLKTEDGPLFDAAQDAMEELNFSAECPEVSDLLRAVDDDRDEYLDDLLEEPAELFEDDDFNEDNDEDDDYDGDDWDEDAGHFEADADDDINEE